MLTVAICKTCGKKYSKWTTPVSARGVCSECFEAELSSEREVAPPEDVSPEPMAQLDSTPQSNRAWPVSAKIAAIYLIICGSTSIPLFLSAAPEFPDKPIEWRAGYYGRQIIPDFALIIAGLAVLERRPWARKFGVTVLVLTTYDASTFFRVRLRRRWAWSEGSCDFLRSRRCLERAVS